MSRNTNFDYSWRMTSCQDSFSASWKLQKFKIFTNIQNFPNFRDFGKIIEFSQSLASFFPSLLIKFIFINSVNFMNIRRHFKNFCPITKISFSIFPRWWHQSLLWSCDKVFSGNRIQSRSFIASSGKQVQQLMLSSITQSMQEWHSRQMHSRDLTLSEPFCAFLVSQYFRSEILDRDQTGSKLNKTGSKLLKRVQTEWFTITE